MYRKVDDFIEDWEVASAGTLSVIQAITNDKLDQSIVEGHSSLGWLAWHLAGAAGAFGHFAGLQVQGPAQEEPVPTDVAIIAETYEKLASAIKSEATNLSDESLLEEVSGFGGPVARGGLLRNMIDHQTHHRGQMTVLLRQAGLTVPGVMGPTKEMQ